MFRLGKRSRWTVFENENKTRRMRDASIQSNVEKAARDLLPREDEEVSVYRVDDAEQVERLAAVYSATVHQRPRDVEYVMIPDDCLEGYDCIQSPSVIGAQELWELHHEILGLQERAPREELARRILKHGGTRVDRISEKRIIERACSICCVDDEVKGSLFGSWPEVLAGSI